MKKISIIVPFFNAENYIENCVEKLLRQTYKNIEIVLVNDNSSDNSEKLVRKYLQNEKVKYYKIQENTIGNSRARNLGIEKSTGDYFIFVDVDDYIDENLLCNLSEYTNEEYDLVKYKMTFVSENNEIIKKINGPIFDGFTGEEAFNRLCFEDVLLDSPCVYLIKKEIFVEGNFKFKENTYHEDFGLIPLVILKAKKVASCDIYGYFYIQSQNSIMRHEKRNLKKAYDKLTHYDNIVNCLEKMNISERTKDNVKIYYTNSIIMSLKDLNSNDSKNFIKEIKKRKMQKNIKVRNFKQLIKRIIFSVDIQMYTRIK